MKAQRREASGCPHANAWRFDGAAVKRCGLLSAPLEM